MLRDHLGRTFHRLHIEERLVDLARNHFAIGDAGGLASSEAIARKTAEAMDAPTAVTPAEEQALLEIARELRVDDGESWAALLRELQAPSARTG